MIRLLIALFLSLFLVWLWAMGSLTKRTSEPMTACLTLFLHRALDIASITGKELGYLENGKEGQAALYMRLQFCGAVEDANKLIATGAMPFPTHIDQTGLQQGGEIIKQFQATKCDASITSLLESIPKLQSRYK
jgi:hypothetical protein